MRSAAATLCLLAVLCTVDATSLNLLLRQVQNTIQSVQGIIQQLERVRSNAEQDVSLAVMKKLLERMEEYDNYVVPILDTIRKEVDEAKARGKDAQPCYDSALNTLRSIGYEADLEARRCQECAKVSIKENLSFIDDLITTGRQLIGELNNIIPDCYKENSRLIDTIKLRSCIVNRLRISKVDVKKLKTDASSAASTAKSASNPVLQQATDCLKNVYSIAHSKVPVARSDATRCLNLVQEVHIS